MAGKTFRNYVKFPAVVTGAFFVRNALVLVGITILVFIAWLRITEVP